MAKQKNLHVRLETLLIPEEGLSVHLRGYGCITVFNFETKNGRIDYISTNMENLMREKLKRRLTERITLYQQNWNTIKNAIQ